jgi:hypothetical protein
LIQGKNKYLPRSEYHCSEFPFVRKLFSLEILEHCAGNIFSPHIKFRVKSCQP